MKNEQEDFSGEIKREMAVPTKGTADCGQTWGAKKHGVLGSCSVQLEHKIWVRERQMKLERQTGVDLQI